MQRDLLTQDVTPAEGESSVRTYYCTYYQSRLLGLQASGYLGVTNKRVIFHAQGTSNAGSSIIQSEVPVEDVSGISSYKGTYFSFGHLISAFVVSVVAAGLVPLIITFSAQIDFDAVIVIGWIIAGLCFLGSFFVTRETIWKSMLVAASASALSTIGGASLLSSFFFRSGEGWELFLAAIVGIYALVCFFWYSRRPTFTLAINSKGGSNTPISISGASGIGIFDIAAGKALNAAPVGEAEKMLKELGAVILDVQQLGDLGIAKWKAS